MKKLTSQPEKCGSQPSLTELTGPATPPTILRQLADRMGDWSFEDALTAPEQWYFLTLQGQARFSRRLCVL
jgi:hypothetical protein